MLLPSQIPAGVCFSGSKGLTSKILRLLCIFSPFQLDLSSLVYSLCSGGCTTACLTLTRPLVLLVIRHLLDESAPVGSRTTCACRRFPGTNEDRALTTVTRCICLLGDAYACSSWTHDMAFGRSIRGVVLFSPNHHLEQARGSGTIDAVPAHLVRLQNRIQLLLLALGPLRPVAEHDT